MKLELLLKMLELANSNRPLKSLTELCLQIAVDPELNDEVKLEDFSNEFYSVGHIRFIKNCFNFKVN